MGNCNKNFCSKTFRSHKQSDSKIHPEVKTNNDRNERRASREQDKPNPDGVVRKGRGVGNSKSKLLL